MPDKVRWGVLSTALIAVGKVIPAMQKGEWSEISAIASREARASGKQANKSAVNATTPHLASWKITPTV